MCVFLPTTILRHRKENLKKCSLRNLESHKDLCFLTYPLSDYALSYLERLRSSLPSPILLTLNAPPLSKKEKNCPLLLIDATWNYAKTMEKTLRGEWNKRSIPQEFRTAYPRKQNGCSDPEKGLASVEALYIAYLLLEKNPEGLLENYFWKDSFLKINRTAFSNLDQN